MDLLDITTYSYAEKVILMFRSFPYHRIAYESLYKELQSTRQDGIVYSYYDNHSRFMDICVGGIGIFCKNINIDNEYSLTLTGLCDRKEISLKKVPNDQVDKICEKVIPFLLSNGKNKKTIPLLMNSFPEFAKFALEFVYDPEY